MKVFLSYSHADQAFAHGLRNSIEKLGVTVEDPAGAGHALGKLVLGVGPEPRNARLRELPADLLGFAVMDASNKPLDAIAKTLVHAMEPA